MCVGGEEMKNDADGGSENRLLLIAMLPNKSVPNLFPHNGWNVTSRPPLFLFPSNSLLFYVHADMRTVLMLDAIKVDHSPQWMDAE